MRSIAQVLTRKYIKVMTKHRNYSLAVVIARSVHKIPPQDKWQLPSLVNVGLLKARYDILILAK